MSDVAALLAWLEPKFSEQGYKLKKTERVFIKRGDEGNVFKIFVDVLRYSKGAKKVSINCHIRIEELEQVYAKHDPNLSEAARKSHATVVINCDYLYPRDSLLSRSLLFNEETFAEICELVWRGITDYVFPFVERYSDRDRLVKNLTSEDPKERISNNPVTRHVIPMADAALNNDLPGFERYGEAFLKFSTGRKTARYHPLAEAFYKGIKQEYFSGG